MAVGKHPVLDWGGKPIPGAIESPLAGPYTAVRMCWMCRASGADKYLAFTDCRCEASWRQTRFTHESYIAYMTAMGFSLPVLLLLVIGFGLECISIGTLHAYGLGVSAHVIGNTFWETITRRCWGKANQEENTLELEKAMKKWCKENKVSSRIQGQLHKERIRAASESGIPSSKLRGPRRGT